MKPFNVNTNSWHYKIATIPGDGVRYKCQSVCDYVKSFSGGFILFTLFCAFILGLATLLGNLIVCVVRWLVWHIPFNVAAASTAMFLCILIIVVGGAFGIHRLSKWKTKRRVINSRKEPGFISVAYKSLRDKVCIPVTFDGRE